MIWKPHLPRKFTYLLQSKGGCTCQNPAARRPVKSFHQLLASFYVHHQVFGFRVGILRSIVLGFHTFVVVYVFLTALILSFTRVAMSARMPSDMIVSVTSPSQSQVAGNIDSKQDPPGLPWQYYKYARPGSSI